MVLLGVNRTEQHSRQSGVWHCFEFGWSWFCSPTRQPTSKKTPTEQQKRPLAYYFSKTHGYIFLVHQKSRTRQKSPRPSPDDVTSQGLSHVGISKSSVRGPRTERFHEEATGYLIPANRAFGSRFLSTGWPTEQPTGSPVALFDQTKPEKWQPNRRKTVWVPVLSVRLLG